MTDDDTAEDWRRYYEKTGQRPPAETLLRALDAFAAEGAEAGFAVDLGSGSGRDAVELLRRGWRVLAVDAQASAMDKLRSRIGADDLMRLETCVAPYHEASWPAAQLINSSFALPLCPRTQFMPLWQRIVATLQPGGRFAGQFYGDRDEWAGDPTLTHLTRAEAEALLADLEVEMFREQDDDSVNPRGKAKHWHIFHIVARKAEARSARPA